MSNGINIEKNPQNIMGQLLQKSFDIIKAEEAEKVMRKYLKTHAEKTPPEVLLQTIIKGKALDTQLQAQEEASQPKQEKLTDGGEPAKSTTGGKDTLSRLLMAVGAGMAAAGGNTALGPALMQMEENKLNREQKLSESQHISPAEAEKISLQGQKEMMVEAYKSTLQSGEKGMLKPNELLNKFEPVANQFQGIVDSYSRVKASIESPSAAGDLSMIFNYMKILDPGSVVRESEYATAQNAAAVPERIRAMYNSVINGKKLSDTQRNDFSDRAEKLFLAKERQYRQSEEQFKTLAIENRLDPNKIFRKISYVPPLATGHTEDGYRFKGGNPSDKNNWEKIQ